MKFLFFLLVTTVLLGGCAYKPETFVPPTTNAYRTTVHDDLISLPPPAKRIVVAVYNFRDQTGQYKSHPAGTTFSTAVTQGATSMLIEALKKTGWFVIAERESLSNLLTERKIVRAAEEKKKGEIDLPPLLFAPYLLEGGIIAYETNLLTGGFGAKYFGAGGSTEHRQDMVTIYVRTVDVGRGEVVSSVSTSKTILSQQVDFGVFRFVRVKRLLEIETGFSVNEPPQMCVLEAIEKAVLNTILENVITGKWALANPTDINTPLFQGFIAERGEVAPRRLEAKVQGGPQ